MSKGLPENYIKSVYITTKFNKNVAFIMCKSKAIIMPQMPNFPFRGTLDTDLCYPHPHVSPSHSFSCETMKSWVEPGDEARFVYLVYAHLTLQLSVRVWVGGIR